MNLNGARKIFWGWLCLTALLLTACADRALIQEQAAVPDAPQYAPTARSTPGATAHHASPTPLVLKPLDAPRAVTPNPKPAPILPRQPARNAAALNQFRRGIAYVATKRDEYRSAKSRAALDALFSTGANYISVLVTWYQSDIHATAITPLPQTPSDMDLAFVIAYAHAHGVRVLLKPQLDLNDAEHWRGQIQFDNERDWMEWFASYREFVLYYARFAQAHGVEEFAVGTELVGTTGRTADWRALIRTVREEYTGLLTYSANHSGEEMQIKFWDDLDYIGVNAFYHLTNYRTPTMQDTLEGWDLPARQLTNLHGAFPNQPIVFTEVGYPSMDLASVWPWNWRRGGAVDLEEQALLYEGLFQTWWFHPERPWFRGMFIWNWLPDPNQGGSDDTDYTPHGKPAAEILRRYYQMRDAAATDLTVTK